MEKLKSELKDEIKITKEDMPNKETFKEPFDDIRKNGEECCILDKK